MSLGSKVYTNYLVRDNLYALECLDTKVLSSSSMSCLLSGLIFLILMEIFCCGSVPVLVLDY